jgi:spore coat polysaccharide biosynthesis predicted glycosyltransferase SpsG
MEQTAVEWLVSKLPQRMLNYLKEEIEQANEMEKQKIIDAYQQGFNNAYFNNPLSKEQYYNEIFKNK